MMISVLKSKLAYAKITQTGFIMSVLSLLTKIGWIKQG